MKLKSLIILSLMFIFGSVAFAAPKPERSVYGVFSETFSGVAFDAASSNENSVHLYTWQYNHFKDFAEISDADAKEGKVYWKIENGDGDYGACGIHVTNNGSALDMSSYGYVKFLVKSSCTSMGNLIVGINNGSNHGKKLSELGFVADDKWHEIVFPLEGIDLSNVSCLLYFQLGGQSDPGAYNPGDIIYFDNIRWLKSNSATSPKMDLSLLKVKDNSAADEFTYALSTDSDSVDMDTDLDDSAWISANQYVKIDVDFDNLVFNETGQKYDVTQNLFLKIYTNNTSDSANPKYDGDKDKPMGLVNTSDTKKAKSLCWRVSDVLLTKEKLKIYEINDEKGPHFSDDKNELHYNYSWLQDQKQNGYSKDYANIWQSSSNEKGIAFSEATFLPGKFPVYLYIGADFSNVAGGEEYSTNTLTVELLYE